MIDFGRCTVDVNGSPFPCECSTTAIVLSLGWINTTDLADLTGEITVFFR
jgi:hypothetical protein